MRQGSHPSAHNESLNSLLTFSLHDQTSLLDLLFEADNGSPGRVDPSLRELVFLNDRLEPLLLLTEDTDSECVKRKFLRFIKCHFLNRVCHLCSFPGQLPMSHAKLPPALNTPRQQVAEVDLLQLVIEPAFVLVFQGLLLEGQEGVSHQRQVPVFLGFLLQVPL